jgi:hypothetical protein
MEYTHINLISCIKYFDNKVIVGDKNSDIVLYEILPKPVKLWQLNLQISKIYSIIVEYPIIYIGSDKRIGMVDIQNAEEIMQGLKSVDLGGDTINGMYIGKEIDQKKYLFCGFKWDALIIAINIPGIKSK